MPRPPGPRVSARRRTVYRRLSVETPLDWDDWYDFYQVVIQPLVSEAGADVQLHLKLEARGRWT